MSERRPGPKRGPREQKDRPETTGFRITCSMCGREDTVPFEPTRGTAVLCRACFDVKRRRRDRNREMLKKIVGKHVITCENCGVEAEVNYKRYSQPVKLCDDCFRKLKGEPDDSRRPKRLQVMTRITCCKCGKSDFVDFVPEDDSKVLCRSCYRMESES